MKSFFYCVLVGVLAVLIHILFVHWLGNSPQPFGVLIAFLSSSLSMWWINPYSRERQEMKPIDKLQYEIDRRGKLIKTIFDLADEPTPNAESPKGLTLEQALEQLEKNRKQKPE